MASQARILIFGYLPPPVFGPSVTFQTLLRSSFAKRYDIKFINLSVVTGIDELGRFRSAKLWRGGRLVAVSWFWLMRRRWDCVLYPPGFSRSALIKDWLLLGMAQACGLPTVAIALGPNMRAFRRSLPNWQRRAWDRLWRRARAVMVLADCLRKEFYDVVEPKRVQSVLLGIEVPEKMPPRHSDPNAVRFLYLGALTEAKGFLNLLRAFRLVRERRPSVTLQVAGGWANAEEREAGMRLVAELDDPSSVTFHGIVTGLAKWELLRSCDALVFPPQTEQEAFGLVMLEALCAGLPIVATAGGARSEVLRDGINGWLVPSGDIIALAGALVKLAENPSQRAAMGAANERYFAANFTHEQFGLRLSALVDKVINGN